jgi:hypothetical protein
MVAVRVHLTSSSLATSHMAVKVELMKKERTNASTDVQYVFELDDEKMPTAAGAIKMKKCNMS